MSYRTASFSPRVSRLCAPTPGQRSDDVGGPMTPGSRLGLPTQLGGALVHLLVLVVHDAPDSLNEAFGRPHRGVVLATPDADAQVLDHGSDIEAVSPEGQSHVRDPGPRTS